MLLLLSLHHCDDDYDDEDMDEDEDEDENDAEARTRTRVTRTSLVNPTALRTWGDEHSGGRIPDAAVGLVRFVNVGAKFGV